MTILKKTIILISTLLLAALISCSTQKHTTLYQLPTQTPQQMMSYVIITKDGHCIVIDGGNKGDADYLLKFIKEKTNMKKPVIDAWIFSHVHSDHVSTFIALANLKRDEFTVKKIYYNFPSAEFISKYDYTDTTVLTMSDFYAAVDKLEGTEVIIPQNNDKFTIGDVEVEILMVQDEEADFMKNSNVVNNSSMIFRLTVGNQTVLFLGDSGVEQGNELLKMHGDNLKRHGPNVAPRTKWRKQEFTEPSIPAHVYGLHPNGCMKTMVAAGTTQVHGRPLKSENGWRVGVKHHCVDMDGLHEIRFPFKFD